MKLSILCTILTIFSTASAITDDHNPEMKNRSNLRGSKADEALVSVSNNSPYSTCKLICDLNHNHGAGYSNCMNRCYGLPGNDDYGYDDDWWNP